MNNDMDVSQMQKLMQQSQAPDTTPTKQAGFTPESMIQIMNTGKFTPQQSAMALGHSTGMLQNLFTTPLQSFQTGQSGDVLEQSKGALKQAAGDISSVGLQHAGPVGQQIMSSAEQKGGGAAQFAEAIKSGESAFKPQGLQQEKGAAGTMLAESITPGGIGKLFSGKGFAPAIKNIGKSLAEKVIPKSSAEAGRIISYKASTPLVERAYRAIAGLPSKSPSTGASVAFEKGLLGGESMMGVQAKRASSSLWKDVISPALKSSTQVQDIPSFFKEAEQQIIGNVKELGDRNSQLEALKSIEEEYAKNPTATMEELQGFKEGWAKHVPQKYYAGKDITGIYNNVRAELSSLARQKIYEAVGPEAKQAYLDYGNLKSIEQLGQEAITGKIKGGFGTSLKGILETATVPIGTVGGQTIYKVGRGLELMGPPGATTIRSLFQGIVNPPTNEDTQ